MTMSARRRQMEMRSIIIMPAPIQIGNYDDFEDGESYLQLSRTERDMIDLVTSNFDNVTSPSSGIMRPVSR